MSSKLRFHVFETNLGWVGVTFTDAGLHSIALPRACEDEAMREVMMEGGSEPASEKEARSVEVAVERMIAGQPAGDGLLIDWSGITSFRRAVLEECMRIPAGQTLSYGELGARVGHPRSARAVGRVMATNPWPLLVPCHRVVGSTGHLHGYGGGLPMKEHLLRAEGASFPPAARVSA